MVGTEIRRSGYEGMLPGGVVLTGGTAQLPKLDKLAREMLDLPVRIGMPTNLEGLSDTIEAPPYATGIGLVQWGMSRGIRRSPAAYSMSHEPGNWRAIYDRFKDWLKEFLP